MGSYHELLLLILSGQAQIGKVNDLTKLIDPRDTGHNLIVSTNTADANQSLLQLHKNDSKNNVLLSDIDRRESLMKMQSSFVESEFMRDSTEFLMNNNTEKGGNQEDGEMGVAGETDVKSSGSSWGGYAHQLNSNILDPSGTQDHNPSGQTKDPKALKEDIRRKMAEKK